MTLESRRVTFFSRSKNRLWTKGETSGNFLERRRGHCGLRHDTLLVTAHPHGPTCHTGTRSCFGDDIRTDASSSGVSDTARIGDRAAHRASVLRAATRRGCGLKASTRIAQKVGEEGVEVALAAVTQADDRLVSESADLLFHLALLLKSRELSLTAVVTELEQRHAHEALKRYSSRS